MFSFIYKKKLIQNQIELISLHIPKTAGTSFRNTLKQVYGETAVVRLDIDLQNEELKIEQQNFSNARLNSKVKVVHGHFSPKLLYRRFNIKSGVPIITWLRHPVDRVISNYYYLEKRLKEELQEEAKNLNILSKMQRTLLEYAQHELNQNRMSKFLEDIALSDLYFIGIQEFYSDDLKTLSLMLNWPSIKELHHNITGIDYGDVSQRIRETIAALNTEDMKLYEKAIELRRQRLNLK